MSYAHKLTTYEDMPRVKIVYCSVCGQEDNLSGPCRGPFVDSKKFDKQFRDIFGKEPIKISKSLRSVLDSK